MNENSGEQQGSQGDLDLVVQQLNGGQTAEAVRDNLVERGMAPADALSVVHRACKRALYDGAIALLNKGYSPDAVKEQLVAKGWGQPTAEFVVGEIVARDLAPRRGRRWERGVGEFAGIGMMVVGLGLFVGNVSGAFPTLPYAGFILMGVGGLILGAEKAR